MVQEPSRRIRSLKQYLRFTVSRGAPALLAVALCGCADFGGPIGAGGGAAPEEVRMREFDARLTELGRKVDNLKSSTPGQAQTLTRLESELRELRGEVETLQHSLEGRDKRAKELYQDLDRRVQKIENEARPARLSMEGKIADVPPMPASQEEEAAYVQAFDRLKAGAYDEAIAGFKAQLAQWPTGRFAVNALYWSGEAYAAKRDFESARSSFMALLAQFPTAEKAPDAQFKLGVAEWELKRRDAAKAAWQKVAADFPQSNAAGLARQRLESSK